MEASKTSNNYREEDGRRKRLSRKSASSKEALEKEIDAAVKEALPKLVERYKILRTIKASSEKDKPTKPNTASNIDRPKQ